MKKRLQHNELPPHLEEFRRNYLAATEVEATLCGIITCYKMYGAYFIRSKSSLTGKRVRKDKRFHRTMHNAGLLARASEWVTPVYNSLTEDWRCHDLYRKLVGLGVKLLHQGATQETVQAEAWEELTRLGYRTEWPEWELPPELEKWVEEEGREVRKSGRLKAGKSEVGSMKLEVGCRRSEDLLSEDNAIPEVNSMEREGAVQGWIVNEKGRLVFVGLTSNVHAFSTNTISAVAVGFTCLEEEVAMPPPVD